jgi:hypothetical protein
VHPITRLAGPVDGVIKRTEEVGELAILCPRASPHPYPCRITRAIIFPVDPVASLRRAAPRFPQRTPALQCCEAQGAGGGTARRRTSESFASSSSPTQPAGCTVSSHKAQRRFSAAGNPSRGCGWGRVGARVVCEPGAEHGRWPRRAPAYTSPAFSVVAFAL